jgi:hypothetical protein
VALDGDATILPPTTADELITKVSHRDARWHVRLMRRTHTDGGAYAAEGEHECAADGSCRPPSWFLPPSLMVLINIEMPLLYD